ncbi:hypothetical protein B0H10DRAFT_2208132 [Mycena sp. CBHHK59/15]|nr:hypothetical protein B0H10DRAFT_2208132 [Mycena sp. CBHHK59/15]
MATFASAAFTLWAPCLYQYYHQHDDALHQHLPHLPHIFAKSVFSCVVFNFRPNVWTFHHHDVLNGGHLVLWDLKLVIKFPPGALILIPSATLSHSNVPVQEGDKRISFTQFTASGNGFHTERVLEEQDPEEFTQLAAAKDSRWEMGLGLLSVLSSRATLNAMLVDYPSTSHIEAGTWLQLVELWNQNCTEYHNHEEFPPSPLSLPLLSQSLEPLTAMMTPTELPVPSPLRVVRHFVPHNFCATAHDPPLQVAVLAVLDPATPEVSQLDANLIVPTPI